MNRAQQAVLESMQKFAKEPLGKPEVDASDKDCPDQKAHSASFWNHRAQCEDNLKKANEERIDRYTKYVAAGGSE